MAKGVQIIWTPWRNHSELLDVRVRLYGPRPSPQGRFEDPRRRVCEQIQAWTLRGNLPHAVESTWLLTEAELADEMPGVSIFSIKAGYVTALSRFVTGLLDAEQDSKYKVSMYTKATQIGLPAVFVDIRHEAAHGEMPSLFNLRQAGKQALKWLWEDYWRGLGEEQEGSCGGQQPAPREAESIAAGAEQSGQWTQWQGKWSGNAIGAAP